MSPLRPTLQAAHDDAGAYPLTSLAARNALVTENLSLATVLAKRAKLRFPPSIELDDLFQEACTGLIEAAAKWDPASPVYFRVYAWRRVWGAMMDAHRRRHWVNSTHEDLEEAANVGVMPDVVTAIDCKKRKRALAEVIEMLPARPRAIVIEYYGRDRKNREIGARMDLSESRVGAAHRGALVEMKRGLVARGIKRAA